RARRPRAGAGVARARGARRQGGAASLGALRRREAARGPGAGAALFAAARPRRRAHRSPRRGERPRRHRDLVRALPRGRDHGGRGEPRARGAGGGGSPPGPARRRAGGGGMRARALLRLVVLGLRRDLRGLLLAVVGVAAGVGALLFFLAAGLGTGELLRTRILPVDARLIEAVPPAVSLGLFGKVELDEATVEELAALPGVKAVYRKMRVRAPAACRFDGDFFGR